MSHSRYIITGCKIQNSYEFGILSAAPAVMFEMQNQYTFSSYGLQGETDLENQTMSGLI